MDQEHDPSSNDDDGGHTPPPIDFIEYYHMDESDLDIEDDPDEQLDELFVRLEQVTEESPDPGPGGDEDDGEGEEFDITLPAAHSYLGELERVRGGDPIPEVKARYRVVARGAGGALFPRDTVPILLPPRDATLFRDALRGDKMFALLAPDPNASTLSGYGVLCEMLAGLDVEQGRGLAGPGSLAVKARSLCRVRVLAWDSMQTSAAHYHTPRMVEVEVLPERQSANPLREITSGSWDRYRQNERLRPLVSLSSSVLLSCPVWLWEQHDFPALRKRACQHFRDLNIENRIPEELVSCSYWVCSNVLVSEQTRCSLLAIDSPLERLYAALAAAEMHHNLVCVSCASLVAKRNHVFPMTCDGLRSTYTNPSGYCHDVLTVSTATGVTLRGASSSECSWFPGYRWTLAVCAACNAHLGWRFTAEKRSLRPYQFFGVSRSSVQATHVESSLKFASHRAARR